MARTRSIFCAALLVLTAPVVVAPVEAGQPSIEALQLFEEHIAPTLMSKCVKCHGANKQEGGLRLDDISGLRAGGDRGPALVSGDATASLLYQAIAHVDEDLAMPPDEDRLSDRFVADVRRWIEWGAPWPATDPPYRLTEATTLGEFTEEDRQWWSFRPIESPPVPENQNSGWARNEIDHFVERRLATASIAPAPEADRTTLLRRLYFNLLGRPPALDEIAAFRDDKSPQAYENLVDQLLENPQYGERWARHWLDLVRYADSDGFKNDAYRSHAWRYRDYVIQSLNEDKPYDRFLQEQIAGDELFPNDAQALTATGFLRHWPLEDNQKDVERQWTLVLNDVTEVTSEVVLGIGMRCARCHDHKYDPIRQTDYYRMQAFFAGMVPHDNMLSRTQQHQQAQTAWNEVTAEIRREIEQIETAHRTTARRRASWRYPDYVQTIYKKAPAEWSPLDRQYAYFINPQLDKDSSDFKLLKEQQTRLDELEKKLASHDHLRPAKSDVVQGVCEVGDEASPTYLPGDQSTPIAAGFPSLFDPADATIVPPAANPQASGRRATLARWLTSDTNPLTARVIVNRLWQQYFGIGLVPTASDFGRQGDPPTHPELLDWLAQRLIDDDWSLKKMHRLIATSATFRQDWRGEYVNNPPVADDRDNTLLWQMRARRLEAEQIRDALLAVSGLLDPSMGGPSVQNEKYRRSIYLRQVRNQRDPFLAAFDFPDLFNSCGRRHVTVTPVQALWIKNSEGTARYVEAFAARVEAAHPEDHAAQNNLAYLLAYSRPPTDREQDYIQKFRDRQDDEKLTLEDLCHVLMNTNEFLSID